MSLPYPYIKFSIHIPLVASHNWIRHNIVPLTNNEQGERLTLLTSTFLILYMDKNMTVAFGGAFELCSDVKPCMD